MMKKISKIIQTIFFVFCFFTTTTLSAQTLPNHPEINPEQSCRFGFASLLLGGTVNGKWVSAEELQGHQRYHFFRLWGGESCNLYSAKGFIGEGIMSALHNEHPGCIEGVSPSNLPFFHIHHEKNPSFKKGHVYLNLLASWDAMPRKAQILSPSNSIYQEIVKRYLASQGLTGVSPRLMQLFKVDLEGDGTEETFIYAQNIMNSTSETSRWEVDQPLTSGTSIPKTSQAGHYSLLLLRKIVDGKIKEIPLGQFIASDTQSDDTLFLPPVLHKIYQFADLNGDGILEIIVGKARYDKYAYQIYEVKNGIAKKVLENGTGSFDEE